MTFKFSIPTPNGPLNLEIPFGSSLYFVGANGGGKTRLAVKIEEDLGDLAHRISAHRALDLDPGVPKVSEEVALRGLKYGYAGNNAAVGYRAGYRWESKSAIKLLADYSFVVQALFANQSNISLQTHVDVRAGKLDAPRLTKFEQLVAVWDRVLPHRKLHLTGDDIKVSTHKSPELYSATEMSDGERAIFYLIGQTLSASPSSLIIFDEPELHIHRSVMASLWDELEALRPDCAMVIISHDLEFIASRRGQKFVLRDYAPATGWAVEEVPEESGFSEELATLILGSRRPVLFVEGAGTSLDLAIYRACYPNWMVIPRGSCTEVLHAVVTMRANQALTRVHCAGIVDADDYNESDIEYFKKRGVEVLPVSEIENLLLLPEIIEAIAQTENFHGAELQVKKEEVLNALFDHAAIVKNQNDCIMKYCRRRIDRALKRIDLSDAQDVAALKNDYDSKTAELDISKIAAIAQTAIQKAINEKDAAALLKWYDSKKALINISAKAKNTLALLFEQWLIRTLRNNSAPTLSTALQKVLPVINAVP